MCSYYALFLKGARRVEKSTLALKLGRGEYKSFIEIRFDKASNEIKELFVNSLEDLEHLFNKLQIFYKTRLYVRESLIILEYTIEVLHMDFEEFMLAMNDDITIDLIKEHYTKLKSLGKINKDIMKSFREYLLVGGMPQAILEYTNSKDFGKVDFVKQNILNLYENDIEVQDEENPNGDIKVEDNIVYLPYYMAFCL